MGLHPSRFWDEGYALDNVRSLLVEGTFEPVRGYYPSPVFNAPAALLVAGLEKVHSATGREAFDAIDRGGFQPAAYLALRWWHALYGALTVVVLFLLGRRLFGAPAGWVAAGVLAFLPWHIHASGVFKPDVLLVLAVVAALYATVRTLDGSSPRWAILTGLAISVAASAKLTGVLIAMPLVIGTAVAGWRERRRLVSLAAAGASAAVAFWLTNPYWSSYLHTIQSLKRDYKMRADQLGWDHADVLRQSVIFLGDRWVHGAVLAIVAAVVWLVLLAAHAFPRQRRRVDNRGRRAAILAILLFPLLYVGIYTAQTTYFKPNNILPVVPISCLLIGVAVSAGWAVMRRAVVQPRARAVAAVVGGLLVAGLVVPEGLRYTYRQCVPHTHDLAQLFFARAMDRNAAYLTYVEALDQLEPEWHGRRSIPGAVVGVERVDSLPPHAVERSDGVVFDGRRLVEVGARFHAALMASVERRHLRIFTPSFLRSRGPQVIAIRQVHDRVETAALELSPCGRRGLCRRGRLPTGAGPASPLLSVELAVATRPQRELPSVPLLFVGGKPTALYLTGVTPNWHRYVSERFVPSGNAGRMRFELPEGEYRIPRSKVAASWARWTRSTVSSSEGPVEGPVELSVEGEVDVVGVGEDLE